MTTLNGTSGQYWNSVRASVRMSRSSEPDARRGPSWSAAGAISCSRPAAVVDHLLRRGRARSRRVRAPTPAAPAGPPGSRAAPGRSRAAAYRACRRISRPLLRLPTVIPLSMAAKRSIISRAVSAASKPLLPALVPARSIAWSRVSAVTTPKTTGIAGLQADLRDALGHLVGHEREVRRVALDDAAQADHRGVAAAAARALGGQRDLEPARHPGLSTCASATPWRRRQSCAPSSSSRVKKSLKRLATIAIRRAVRVETALEGLAHRPPPSCASRPPAVPTSSGGPAGGPAGLLGLQVLAGCCTVGPDLQRHAVRRSPARSSPGPRSCAGCWSSAASGARRGRAGSARRGRTRAGRRGKPSLWLASTVSAPSSCSR